MHEASSCLPPQLKRLSEEHEGLICMNCLKWHNELSYWNNGWNCSLHNEVIFQVKMKKEATIKLSKLQEPTGLVEGLVTELSVYIGKSVVSLLN